MARKEALRPRKSVGVVLINWNGTADTLECIESLLPQLLVGDCVVVVDAASRPAERQALVEASEYCGYAIRECLEIEGARSNFSTGLGSGPLPRDVHILLAEENVGFCVGNNIGAEFALNLGCDVVWVLNNDTVACANALSAIRDACVEFGGAALLATRVNYYSDPGTVWWCGGRFNRWLMPEYLLQGEQVAAQSDEEYVDTQWVTGCSTIISRELFEELGLYDPQFFIWCEEWDLSLRARAHDVPMKVVMRAQVLHKVGRSLGIISPLTFFYAMRNMRLLRRRHLSLTLRLLMAPIYFIHKLRHALVFSLKYRSWAYLIAFIDAWRPGSRGQWSYQRRRSDPTF